MIAYTSPRATKPARARTSKADDWTKLLPAARGAASVAEGRESFTGDMASPPQRREKPRYRGSRVARHAHGDGAWLCLDLERLHLRAIAAVELVQHLPVQLDFHRARLRRLHERRRIR